MKITRIYPDSQGESHFDEIEIELADAGDIGLLSALQPATGIIFRETAEDYDYAWHPAPRRQYVVFLEGQADFSVSDGETRRFSAGDVVLLEDTSGIGHYSKAVDDKRRKTLFITLD